MRLKREEEYYRPGAGAVPRAAEPDQRQAQIELQLQIIGIVRDGLLEIGERRLQITGSERLRTGTIERSRVLAEKAGGRKKRDCKEPSRFRFEPIRNTASTPIECLGHRVPQWPLQNPERRSWCEIRSTVCG